MRSLQTDDIPGAFKREKNIQNPTNIMTIDDIDGARPSKFQHRGYDKIKAITNAKYSHVFDQFGNRKLEFTKKLKFKSDPFASSKERRKQQLKIPKIQESAYIPRNLGNFRLNKRHYNGLSKNHSNVGEILREARSEVNKSLIQNNSLNLSMNNSINYSQNYSPRSPISHKDLKLKIENDKFQSKILNKVASQDQITNENCEKIFIPSSSDVTSLIKKNKRTRLSERFSIMSENINSTRKLIKNV